MCNMFTHAPTDMFSLYVYDLHEQRLRANGVTLANRLNQLPTPRPQPDLREDDVPTPQQIYESDIETSKRNWERDQRLTFREWATHYRSVNWDDLFNKPIEMFVRNKLSDTIRDYTEYLNEDNRNYQGNDTNLSRDDIQEMCDNFTRDAPTYRDSEPRPLFCAGEK